VLDCSFVRLVIAQRREGAFETLTFTEMLVEAERRRNASGVSMQGYTSRILVCVTVDGWDVGQREDLKDVPLAASQYVVRILLGGCTQRPVSICSWSASDAHLDRRCRTSCRACLTRQSNAVTRAKDARGGMYPKIPFELRGPSPAHDSGPVVLPRREDQVDAPVDLLQGSTPRRKEHRKALVEGVHSRAAGR
jgi:hypothetical protein